MSNPVDLETAGLSRRQLNLVVMVDCSGSMTGDRIASLNFAMRTAVPAIREVAADNPETDVRIRVLRFSTEAEWHVGEAEPIDNFTWTDLKAGGETAMGAALIAVAEILNNEHMPGRQLPPVLVMVSDGQPSDDFEAGLSALMDSSYGTKATRVAIAIGQDADIDTLQRFIGHAQFKPLRAANAKDLVERIRWATTAPIKTASTPTNSPDPLADLWHEASEQNTVVEEMVW